MLFRQLFSSYMYVTCTWKKLPKWRSYKKRLQKTLMKLTEGCLNTFVCRELLQGVSKINFSKLCLKYFKEKRKQVLLFYSEAGPKEIQFSQNSLFYAFKFVDKILSTKKVEKHCTMYMFIFPIYKYFPIYFLFIYFARVKGLFLFTPSKLKRNHTSSFE